MLRGSTGRFASLYDFHKLSVPDARCGYDLLVFDKEWNLVPPLNEWYRLRNGRGSPRTRDTYLSMLCPYLGFLAERRYQWDAEPARVREYMGEFLRDLGCATQRDWQKDGWYVAPSAQSPLSRSGVSLLLAATRDFYGIMAEGVWDEVKGRQQTLYPYPNPMYSEMLLRWKREHLRLVENRGAPNHAGIRGETRERSAKFPIAYFRRGGADAWEPRVASEGKAIRLLILSAFLWMIDHADPRERAILRIMLESAARVHEVLSMTAGGYRRGKSFPGISALVRNKGSMGIENKPIRFTVETEDLLYQYIRTDRASADHFQRRDLVHLPDDAPLFLSRRGTQLTDSGFRVKWGQLRRAAERHFRQSPVRLPHLTPHMLRHGHATERVAQVLEDWQDDRVRQQSLLEAIQIDIGWKSAETMQAYVHAISVAEGREITHTKYIDRLMAHARDLPGAVAQIADSESCADAIENPFDIDQESADTLAWVRTMRGL